MQVLSKLLNKSDQLIKQKEKILEGLADFHRGENEVFKGRDTNKTKVMERIQVLENYFNGFINE